MIIEVLEKMVRELLGEEAGQKEMEKRIVRELTKGPTRIRALTREELKL